MLRYLVSLLSVLVLFTSPLPAANKSGTAEFPAAAKKCIEVTVGDNVKFDSDFHRFEFEGVTAIAANGRLRNTSDKQLNAVLYVAFFDKDNKLIGCTSQSVFLLPGKARSCPTKSACPWQT